MADARSKKQHKKRHAYGGEGGRKQPKGGKHEQPHKHYQKEEGGSERGKFSRRKIENNWSRYDEVAEGEVQCVPLVVGAAGDEESSAAVASVDESRVQQQQQEDLRFKQLVESAKHRMPISDGTSEASSSLSSDLFQIDVSSLADSIQNIPLNERLLMDRGLLVEAGLMEADSQGDGGNLKKMTLSQLRQHKSKDVQSSRLEFTNMRLPHRGLVSPVKALPAGTIESPQPHSLPRQGKVPDTSASTQSATDSHTPIAAEQPLLGAIPQKHSSQRALQAQPPTPDSTRKDAVTADRESSLLQDSNVPVCAEKPNSVGGVVPTTPTKMRSTRPPGAPGSQHKMVDLARNPKPKEKVDEDDDQLDAMLDELLTL